MFINARCNHEFWPNACLSDIRDYILISGDAFVSVCLALCISYLSKRKAYTVAVWVSTVVTKFWCLILLTAPPVNYMVLWLQFTALCALYPPEWKACFNSNVFLYILSFFIQEYLIIHALFWKIWLVQVLSYTGRHWLHHQIMSNCPFLKCTQGLTLRFAAMYPVKHWFVST